MEDETRAQLSTQEINDLPDSAFAFIEDGGTKDDEGKTVPRSLRHFPIHDEAHVRNALSRAPQSPFGEKAMPKIKAAAKKFGIDVADDRSRRNPALGAARERRRKERHRSIALLPEVRYFDPSRVEIRTESDGAVFRLEGSPIMYGAEYRVVDPWGEFVERIHYGSNTEILERGVDCRLLLNHDGLPMARTRSGTMDLWDTPESLRFKASLDARQQLANDFYIAIERRDLDQMSVGMIVGDDKWGEEGSTETRDIYALSDLLDVSGVTYPASPSTAIEVAHRMMMERPVESRARMRRLVARATAGQRLEKDDIAALRSLLTPDLDPGEDTQTPEGTGRLGNPEGNGDTWADEGDLQLPDSTPADGTEGNDATGANAGAPPQDGTGSRSAPTTAAERREQSLSFGDRQTAVYAALCARFGGYGDPDLWICDCGEDWVVWQTYGPNCGLFRIGYSADANGAITLADGQPERVQTQTSYVPVADRSARPRATALRVKRALRGI